MGSTIYASAEDPLAGTVNGYDIVYTSISSDVANTNKYYALGCNNYIVQCGMSFGTWTVVLPTISYVQHAPDPFVPGTSITFTAAWADESGTDSGGSVYHASEQLLVCKTNEVAASSLTCPGGMWASSSPSAASPATASYQSTVSDTGGSHFYAFICHADGTACSYSNSGTFTTTADTLAPDEPFEMLLANDIAYRKGLAFQADENYVRSLYANPQLTAQTRDAGALFTPNEAREEEFRRDYLPGDADAVEALLNSSGAGGSIGGIFIDHEAGGILTVLLTHDADLLRPRLASVVRHPERLVVRLAEVTEATLNWALDNIDYAPIVAQTGTVHWSTVDIANNRLKLAVDDPLAANLADAGATVGVPVWFVHGSPFVDQADQNHDPNVPPYRGGHGISLFDNPSGTGVRSGCTLGFAARNSPGVEGALTAGHCRLDHNNPFVFHNGIYIGNTASGNAANAGKVDYFAYTAVSGKTTDPTVFRNWPDTLKVRATDEGHEKKGYTRIKNGAFTGYSAGVLTELHFDPDGAGAAFSPDFRQASYKCEGLDSGMPVWHPLNGYAYAAGIHKGAAKDGSGCVYSYIRFVLNASGFALKTTS